MTVQNIMAELKAKGSEGIKKYFLKHGIKEPFFVVKVEYFIASAGWSILSSLAAIKPDTDLEHYRYQKNNSKNGKRDTYSR